MNRGKQQFLIFSFGFVIAVILLVGGYFAYNKLVSNGKIKGFNLTSEVTEEEKKVKVLVVVQKVEKGDELKPEFFSMEERPLSDVPVNSILDINFLQGKRAAVVLDPNSVITDSMIISTESLYKPDERLKDYMLQGYLVAGTVKEGDWIDVEMVRSNGDTFIVLSKKQVKKLLDNKAIIQVTAEERYLINHALAEQAAGMGHIESLLYLDENQPASKVNYVPAKIQANGQVETAPINPPQDQSNPNNELVQGGRSR